MRVCPTCRQQYPDEHSTCLVDGDVLELLEDPWVGRTVSGRFVVEASLGQGGMATVYRAKELATGRIRALKVMHDDLADDDVIKERFRREARAAQTLCHPNIIEIFDAGTTEDGIPYLVMELLEGIALAEAMDSGAIGLEKALPLMVDVARGVARAHDLGIVHRDLKPENIFICDADGSKLAKILDFGIARTSGEKSLTQAGELFGTPEYMAPERIRSGDKGPGNDLYALGLVFYEMLAGQLPFEASDPASWFVKHLREEPIPLTVACPACPKPLCELIHKLLAKDAKARPNAHAIVAALVDVAKSAGLSLERERGTPIVPETPPPPAPPVGASLWVKRAHLYRAALHHAFGGAIPAEGERILGELDQIAGQVDALDKELTATRRGISDLENKGRELRRRLGTALDALGADASRLRAALDAPPEDQAQGESKEIARLRQAQREILFWEGRTAGREPYRELAESYRAAATIVDAWYAAHHAPPPPRVDRDAAARELSDTETQITGLRQSLTRNEEEYTREHEGRLAQLLHLEAQQRGRENGFLELASRLTMPLRGRPELERLMHELRALEANAVVPEA